MKYAKLTNGNQLDFAPSSTPTVSNYNLQTNEEMLFADGWKRYVQTERPEISEIQKLVLSFEEAETTITEVWSVVDLMDDEIHMNNMNAFILGLMEAVNG